MSHSNSAKKRVRQNEKNRMVNKSLLSKTRTAVKKALQSATVAPDEEATELAYRQAASQLDKSARKGLIKKNEASRRKARMAKTRNRAAEAVSE